MTPTERAALRAHCQWAPFVVGGIDDSEAKRLTLALLDDVERLEREYDRQLGESNALGKALSLAGAERDDARRERDAARAELAKLQADVKHHVDADTAELVEQLAAARADIERAKERARVAAQTLVEEFGADGPLNVEDAAVLAVHAHERVWTDLRAARADLAAQERTLDEARAAFRQEREWLADANAKNTRLCADLERARAEAGALATLAKGLGAQLLAFDGALTLSVVRAQEALAKAANAVLGGARVGERSLGNTSLCVCGYTVGSHPGCTKCAEHNGESVARPPCTCQYAGSEVTHPAPDCPQHAAEPSATSCTCFSAGVTRHGDPGCQEHARPRKGAMSP